MLASPLIVVQDDPSMQVRLRSILLVALGLAHETLWFADGIDEAYRMLEARSYAMALVDIGQPGGDGTEMIRRLHEHDAALPIVVLSRWNTKQTLMAALRAGASGYLLKERDDIE